MAPRRPCLSLDPPPGVHRVAPRAQERGEARGGALLQKDCNVVPIYISKNLRNAYRNGCSGYRTKKDEMDSESHTPAPTAGSGSQRSLVAGQKLDSGSAFSELWD